MHFVRAKGHTTNFQSALAARWDGRVGEPAPRDCWSACVCLCSVPGRKRKTFSNKFMATLKAFFTRNSLTCDLLMTPRVNVALQARAHDVGPEHDPKEEQVWYISDVDLSPYELTFMDCATQLVRSRLKRRGQTVKLFVRTCPSRGRAVFPLRRTSDTFRD